jgi:hypothetical protein
MCSWKDDIFLENYQRLEGFFDMALNIGLLLELVRNGEIGPGRQREDILARVPHTGDYASFPKYTISELDMAYLSAAAGDGFILFFGKNHEVLYHGTKECPLDEAELVFSLVKSGELYVYAVSRLDAGHPLPLDGDAAYLSGCGQDSLLVISGMSGKSRTYHMCPEGGLKAGNV